MDIKPAVLITSPTSIVGRQSAKLYSRLGYSLVLLSWRSDKAEALMQEILRACDVVVMVARRDMTEDWPLEPLKREIKKAKLVIKKIILIPLVEENTPPFVINNTELMTKVVKQVERKMRELGTAYPLAQIINFQPLLHIKTKLKLALLQWGIWR